MKKTIVVAIVIGIAVLAMFIARSNNTPESTSAQQVETSQESSSQEVGSTPITVISRESGSGTRGAFIELFGVEVKTDAGKKDLTTQEAVIADKTDIVMTSVAGDRNAIGYISLGSLNETVKALEIDNVAPSTESILAGEYVIQRPFNIAVKEGHSKLAANFIEFILSKEGQAVVEANKYISVNSKAAPFKNENFPSGKLVIAGSSSVTPIMEKLKEAYNLINPSATVEVQLSDSTAGMTAAANGTADIGMASRELKNAEKEKLKGIAIAYDGLAVIVNRENPLVSITKDQVKEIYLGNVTDWSHVQ